MELMRESWTDERLDDLNEKVGEGFARVDGRFEQVDRRFERVEDEIKDLRSEMNARFDTVNERLDSMQRSMMQAVVALSVGMLAGFGGLAGLIATQL
jgi:chromosome segregation ATPase